MRARVLTAAGAGVLFTLATAAPATAFESTIDIEAGLGYDGDEYEDILVLAVEGVTAGEGPELTADDRLQNFGEYCGGVEVDVDPDARTITVTGVDDCSFDAGDVWIWSDEFGTVEIDSDDFGGPGDPLVEVETDETGIGVWIWGADTETPFDTSGALVLSYTLAAEEEPAEEEPVEEEPTAPPAPATPAAPAAPAATPVVAAPTFTG